MKMLGWNCRGAARRGFVSLIRDIKKEYSISLLFLVETHTSGPRAERIVRRFGFGSWFVQEAQGQTGGIWILWDEQDWQIEVFYHGSQFVHAHVSWRRTNPWLLTVVYGSPHYQQRGELWDFLREVIGDIDSPWAVVGDFNALLHDHERNKGPTRSSKRSMAGFKDTIAECYLIDAGFQGYPYTWKNGDLEQRLDIMLININWCLRLPEGMVHHLPPFKCDHRPLLVQFSSDRGVNRRRRPFRFLAVWVTHEDFDRFMKCNWKCNMPWNPQIQLFRDELEKWNRETFGNIFERKKKLMRQLERITDQMTYVFSHQLQARQQEIWRQYEEVLGQEELPWFQKSRSKWLAFGDRNSKYFHGITAVRRRRNKVDFIQDEDGN